MPDWVWWVVGALALLALEIISLDLILAMVAVGALAGAVAAALGVGLVGQVLAAAIVSVLCLFGVRPIAIRHLQASPQAATNIDALIGADALVLQRVDRLHGLVRIGGEDWSARTDRSDGTFEPGTHLFVVRIDGATAVVADRPS